MGDNDMVRLKAHIKVWLGDGLPIVQPGEEFETNQRAAFLLLKNGHAEVVEAEAPKPKRTRKTKSEEE